MDTTNAKGTNAWSREPFGVRNHTVDSRRWRDFKCRHSDIVIVTWAKAGTTWVLQIVGQLIFNGREQLPILDMAPWVEHRGYPKEEMFKALEAQAHRRFVKSHLPADALIYWPSAKYIYVGRDGLEVIWSWYQHHRRMSPVAYYLLNHIPGRVGPPLEPPPPTFRECFHNWLDGNGAPLWPFWSHVQSWWDLGERPNVLLVHFADLKANLAQEIRRIAAFLEIDIDEERWSKILEHCSFEHMKTNASTLSTRFDFLFVNGAEALVNRGQHGRWRNELSAADIEKYRRFAAENLTAECARWLATAAT